MSNSSLSPSPSPSPASTPPPPPSSSPSPAPSPSPSPSPSRTMEPSSSTGMELKSESNKRLNTGEPSTSRTMEPSSSTGMESNKRLKTGDLMPVEFFDLTFPPANPFIPNDHELLGYLREKIMGIQLLENQIIEAYVYSHPPEYIAEKYHLIRETLRYFFSPGHGIGPVSLNWKDSKPFAQIITNDGKLRGFKKSMAYFQGNEKTDWRIVEYSVIMEDGCLPSQNWMLCLLYRKTMLNKFIQRQKANEQVKKEL